MGGIGIVTKVINVVRRSVSKDKMDFREKSEKQRQTRKHSKFNFFFNHLQFLLHIFILYLYDRKKKNNKTNAVLPTFKDKIKTTKFTHNNAELIMETILLVGINGTIGKAVFELFTEKGIRCFGTSSDKSRILAKSKDLFYLNLMEPDTISPLKKVIPKINGIVFCAGLEPQLSLSETTWEHHKKMLDIHVTGPLFVVQTLKQKIKKGGSVIFISSIAAQKGSYDPSYAIAKSAVIGMTKTLAKELAPDKIRVNAISPGLVKNTPVHKRMTKDFRNSHLKNTLLQQLTTTKDCAETIFFLFMQKQITGQLIHVNGGQYFGN